MAAAITPVVLGLIGCGNISDTYFIGAARSHQACRAAIDAGRIGRPVGGAVAFGSQGLESWHPNPGFFFAPGGGPMHDMGPYYLTQLVNLLGPVARVCAVASIGNPTRTVSSQPLAGQVIEVTVPTTLNGVLLGADEAVFDAGL